MFRDSWYMHQPYSRLSTWHWVTPIRDCYLILSTYHLDNFGQHCNNMNSRHLIIFSLIKHCTAYISNTITYLMHGFQSDQLLKNLILQFTLKVSILIPNQLRGILPFRIKTLFAKALRPTLLLLLLVAINAQRAVWESKHH